MDKAFTRLKKFVISRRDDEGAVLGDVVEYVAQNLSDLALSFGKSEEQLLDAVKAFEDKIVLCKALLGQIEHDKGANARHAEVARRARVQALADALVFKAYGYSWKIEEQGFRALLKETKERDVLWLALPGIDDPIRIPTDRLKKLAQLKKSLELFVNEKGLTVRWSTWIKGRECFGGIRSIRCGWDTNANRVNVVVLSDNVKAA